MSIQVALSHLTHYRYDRLIELGPQVVRLRPAPHCRTKVLAYTQRIEPAEHFINWQQDPFANYQARLVFQEPTREFKVTVELLLEMAVHNPFDFFLEPYAEQLPFAYPSGLRAELTPYLAHAAATPRLQAYLDAIERRPLRTQDFLVWLNQKLQRDIRYTIRLEPGVQSPEQTLTLGSGSCRDSSWLLVQVLRHLGLAARFVSGYLIQLSSDVKAVDGPSGPVADFTDLHAWCEVFLPGAGWIGLDPTSGLLAGEGHIPLACTPKPSSAAPIAGALDECEVEFSHHMQVRRSFETARVTKPYTEAQWSAIHALGEQVEHDLHSHDVRLTMGGEPTFVATRDRDAPEWNTDALGPTKRIYATDLLHRLRQQYGAGGCLHLGQGKWYPGEQLPRWALSLFWRTDGEPIWQQPALLADEREPAQYGAAEAQRFIEALALQLGLPTEHIRPGFEDTWYYLWRERQLPLNVDPFDSKLDDEHERARLRRVFEQGLQTPAGFVLPLQAEDAQPGAALATRDAPLHSRWRSGPWLLRDQRLYLIPGDSPMGYRLPLDALPWVSAADSPVRTERDPQAPSPALPSAPLLRQPRPAQPDQPLAEPVRAPQRGESAAWLMRTALCVEARDPQRANGPRSEAQHGGQSRHLYVFMPPLEQLEPYLELLAAA